EGLDRDAGKVRRRHRIVVHHEERSARDEPAFTRGLHRRGERAKAALQQGQVRLECDDGDGEPGVGQKGWRVMAFEPETPSTVYDHVPVLASLNDKVALPTWRTFTLDALKVPLLAAGPLVAKRLPENVVGEVQPPPGTTYHAGLPSEPNVNHTAKMF